MILVNNQQVEFKSFPNGETKLIEDSMVVNPFRDNRVSFKYENDGDLIKLMFVKNYIDSLGGVSNLIIYYMPYSRMDRSEGSSAFTLKYVSNFINQLNFKTIKVVEPHSDVTPALLDRAESKYVNFELLPKVLDEIDLEKDADFLMFPDSGASKRYHSLKGYNQLVGHKHRDFKTGEIKSLEVIGNVKNMPLNKVLIVDDLSSFGGTFYFSALKLRELGFKEVYLLVAHCENSIHEGKLLKEGSPIDKIFTTDSILNKGHEKIKVFKIEELL